MSVFLGEMGSEKQLLKDESASSSMRSPWEETPLPCPYINVNEVREKCSQEVL